MVEVVQVTRMDEDSFLLYEEILSLLINAGYYRARIKGLSPFDKIVGGMTWCLQMISQDTEGIKEDFLDDLLFSEDVSIGSQVALTEKIVRALITFGCPFEIDPHQMITGEMDFPHILPVIRWLLERGMEARAKLKNIHRQIALRTFYDQYGFLFPSQLLEKSKLSTSKYLKSDIEENSDQSPKERSDDSNLTRKLEDEIEIIDSDITYLEEKRSTLMEKVKSVMANETEKSNLLSSLQEEERSLQPGNPEEDSDEMVAKLSLMIEKSENLKRKEKEFKKNCQEKLDEMISKNEALRKEIFSIENSTTHQGTLTAQKELDDLKIKLSSVSMELMKVERKIEDIPSKFELSQYHKRFVELEDMFESKEFESRKLNISYKTLEELKSFIKNQILNLDHISDSVPLPNSSTMNDFMSQLENLQDEIGTLKKNIDKRVNVENERRSRSIKNLDELTDKYRIYTLLTKDLQDLVNKNEELQRGD